MSIVVAGGGPVGMAAAIALAREARLEVSLVERGRGAPWSPPAGFDSRIYALSPASLAFLVSIGVDVDVLRAAPVYAMHVWSDAHERVVFETGRSLATIVEAGALLHALRAAANAARLTVLESMEIVAMREPQGEGGARQLAFADGSVFEAGLVVAADGAQSRLREAAGIDSARHDYQTDALVANFECGRPHGDIARQWFLDEETTATGGVLALLPLPGRRVSIVWSMARAHAASLQTALEGDPGALAAAVERASGNVLGSLQPLTAVARFPLARITAQRWALPGFVLIGDAAHTVHPLAGQGVNLGFGDAAALGCRLARRSRFSLPGDLALLRGYERERREAAQATGLLTHGLEALFGATNASARWWRNRGFAWLDTLPALKAPLVRAATR
jgi:2-octaprenyl-6-methoxyphenol hydroxylase